MRDDEKIRVIPKTLILKVCYKLVRRVGKERKKFRPSCALFAEYYLLQRCGASFRENAASMCVVALVYTNLVKINMDFQITVRHFDNVRQGFNDKMHKT